MHFRRVAQNLFRLEPHGTYYVVASVAGKKVRRSLLTSDRPIAERLLADALRGLKRLHEVSSQDTWGALAERWKNTVLAGADLKPASRKYRVQTIDTLKKTFPKLCTVPANDITVADCESWRTSRQGSAQRINNEIGTLRMVFDYGVQSRVCTANPAVNLAKLKIPKPAILIPTADQLQSIIENMRSRRGQEAAWLVELLAYSGMRLNEAVCLKWSDIDEARGLFHVTGGETGTKNRRTRWVPIFPRMRELLTRIPRLGLYVSPIRSCRANLTTACAELLLPRYTHHDLRHYFCTEAVEAGVDFVTLAGWMGHLDGGILLAKTYAHLRQDHSLRMAERMGNMQDTSKS